LQPFFSLNNGPAEIFRRHYPKTDFALLIGEKRKNPARLQTEHKKQMPSDFA